MMNSIEWYLTLYYKYRQYPIKHLNALFKNNQLKSIYFNIFTRFSHYFTITSSLISPSAQFDHQVTIRKGGSILVVKKEEQNFDFITASQQTINNSTFLCPKNMKDDPVLSGYEINIDLLRTKFQILINLSGEVLNFLIQKKYSQKGSVETNQETPYDNQVTRRLMESQESYTNISSILDLGSHCRFPETSTTISESKEIPEIVLERIPEKTEEINYFFMQFCTNIDIKSRDTNNTSSKSNISASYSNSSFSSASEQISDISVKSFKQKFKNSKKPKNSSSGHIHPDFDNFLFEFSQTSLDKINQLFKEYPIDLSQGEGLSGMNMLLETWIELILMNEEDAKVTYQIIEKLTQSSKPNHLINPFVQKIKVYLHFITRTQTKKLMGESLSKQNFIMLIPQIIDGSRNLGSIKISKNDGIIQIIDNDLEKPVRNEGTAKIIMKKWKQIGNIASELLLQEENIFWAKTFHDLIALFDTLLMEVIEFSYSTLLLKEKIGNKTQVLKVRTSQEYGKIIQSILNQEVSEFWNGQRDMSNFYHKKPYQRYPIARDKLMESQEESLLDRLYSNFLFPSNIKREAETIVPELKEWELKTHQCIDKFRSYRKLMDSGLKIFQGNPECTAVYFVESYRNFKQVEIMTKKNELEEEAFYSEIMMRIMKSLQEKIVEKQESSELRSKFDTAKREKSQCFLPVEQSKFNKNQKKIKKISNLDIGVNQIHPSASTMLQIEFHSQTFTALAHRIVKSFETGKTEKNNANQNLFISEDEQKSMQSSFHSLEEENNETSIELMKSSTFKHLHSRVKSFKNGLALNSVQTKVYESMNEHLRLLNICNFILNYQAVKKDEGKGKNKKGNYVILCSRELVRDIEQIEKEQKIIENKRIAQSQSKRGNSNGMRQSNHLSPKHENPVEKPSLPNRTRKSSIDLGFLNSHLSDLICEKLASKINEHNIILETLIAACYKEQQFVAREWSAQAHPPEASNQDKSNLFSLIKMYQNPLRSQLYGKKDREEELSSHDSNKSFLFILRRKISYEISKFDVKEELILLSKFNASLRIDTKMFESIQNRSLLSHEKMKKIIVIAKLYYDELSKDLLKLSEVKEYENAFLLQFLPILNALITISYQRGKQPIVRRIGMLLNRFFLNHTKRVEMKREKTKNIDDLINLNKIVGEIFQWSAEESQNQGISLREFLEELICLRMDNEMESITPLVEELMRKEKEEIKECKSKDEKVNLLQFKLFYLVMRELYFSLNFDVSLFDEKTLQAKKNYDIYELKVLEMFEEITKRDEQEFKMKKTEELKQRSAFLQGYLLNYQKQPKNLESFKILAKKVVCIFDKILGMANERRSLEMKKRGCSNHTLKNRSTEPLFVHYVSTEYSRKNGTKVRVFDKESYNLFKAIEIYESMLEQGVTYGVRKYSDCRQSVSGFKGTTHPSILIDQSEVKFLKQNKESIAALWINSEEKLIHEKKMGLFRNNFLTKIQRLYIDLDVRHKVFELFKDKILNYELQKTKIYHQYIDYIRGLKLDVYSHVADEDPLPYFKLINVIKFYRMGIKKSELDEKVHQEFGKNMGKWNQGIQEDLRQYQKIVSDEQAYWKEIIEVCRDNKKELFQIHGIIEKELNRQNKKEMIQIYKENNSRPATSTLKKNSSHIKVRMIPRKPFQKAP